MLEGAHLSEISRVQGFWHGIANAVKGTGMRVTLRSCGTSHGVLLCVLLDLSSL